MLLRIFAPSARFRVTISDNATLYDLYEDIKKQSNRDDISSMHVFLNANSNSIVPRSYRTTIAQAGINDGQVLYVHWKTFQTPVKQEPIKNLEESNKSTNVSSQIPTQSSQQSSSSSTKPKFQSFDAYLKQRSYSIADLPLCMNYRPVNISKNHLTKLPPAVTLKHQQFRHIDHVEFKNYVELSNFVNFWQYDLDMSQQRAGWLIGHYAEDPHYESGIRVIVEAIYEPPQADADGIVNFLNDPFMPTVLNLSETLGVSVVGWVFTHLPREQKLTSKEIIQIIKFQWMSIKTAPSHYTGYPVAPFVTVTISQSDEQKIQTNAYMVSDLAMAFYRDGILAETQLDLSKMQLTSPLKHQVYSEILEAGRTVTSFDPDWLIVRVNDSAPIKSTSIFKSWSFPVENRFESVQLEHIVNFIKDISSNSSANLSDFHFLLYLAKLFDAATANSICHSIKEQVPINPEIIETLITFAQ